MGRKAIDMTGQKFGKLTVVRRVKSKNSNAYWLCYCECGRAKEVRRGHLINGDTKSCRSEGCAQGGNKGHGFAVHGKEAPEYKAWSSMKRRCYNNTSEAYKNYGGRGIAVCDEWLNDFEQFLKDMGKRPSKNHSIDRINNDGNYEPDNCRWVEWEVQNRNKRMNKNNKSGTRGVYLNKATGSWIVTIFNRNKNIRIGTFKNYDDAREARLKAELKYWNEQIS